jgi:hypothetical protein
MILAAVVLASGLLTPAVPRAVAAPAQISIATAHHGLLVIGGHEVAPPIGFEIVHDTLYANGLRVRPVTRRAGGSELHAPVTDVIIARHKLLTRVFSDVALDYKRGAARSEIGRRAKRTLLSSRLVQSVVEDSDGSLWLTWRGERYQEMIGISRPPDARVTATQAETLGREARTMASLMDEGGMVLLGDGYALYVPAVRVSDVMSEIAASKGRRTKANAVGAPGTTPRTPLPPGLLRDLSSPQPVDSLMRK